ncbi:uncharacterized protein LOC121376778 [Gigantopelta aegis]|uniref:uncharacterized protein LOC121376778 n=1 Tax=Gigantopelta aegis TaxID=1735272 RepID=UPI001B88912C|nr:uncharacterized protein LOC121376778 [Gigantopelta aegis]
MACASQSAWSTLRDVVLTRVILFNRRRQGEVSHMTIEVYAKIQTAGQDGFVMDHLSDLEKELSQHFCCVEVRGKRGMTVPVLMNKETKEWPDILMSCRHDAGIKDDNAYVFARTHYGSHEYVRCSDCLRAMSENCGAKEPHLLRSTQLRKQIATMSQILNLKDHELDYLARYLGHDIRVHREYYRLPDQTLQVAKISKLLLATEQGGVGLKAGQQLDDIVIDPEEELVVDSEDFNNEDTDTQQEPLGVRVPELNSENIDVNSVEAQLEPLVPVIIKIVEQTPNDMSPKSVPRHKRVAWSSAETSCADTVRY